MTTRLILVGGFLGAGKTTLLWQAAQRLVAQGHAVGLITNDQAPDLVDTVLLSRSGLAVREVAGSCFCCNFGGFMQAVQSLIDVGATIIIAEPVGSCTDLSATILQPVKDRHRQIQLAPLTVLVDPDRLGEVMDRQPSLMDPDARYILGLQMKEADRILLNKVDSLTPAQRDALLDALRQAFPASQVGSVSARTGEGLEEWLAFARGGDEAGQRLIDVDYDRYAHGEAVLGWLNAAVDLQCAAGSVRWADYAGHLMTQLHRAFKERSAEIGHLKLVISSDSRQCSANLTRLGGDIAVDCDQPLTGQHASLTLNARVQMPPDDLEQIVGMALAESAANGISATIRVVRCLMPGRPAPTHRYFRVV